MHQSTGKNKPSSRSSDDCYERSAEYCGYYRRSPAEDLELWKHYAGFGGEDKNRMVSINTWLLGGSAAIFWFIWTQQIDPDSFTFQEPVRALSSAVVGAAIATLSAYLALLYGGYSNRNWGKADQIARSRGWVDLLPLKTSPKGRGLNRIARRLARPCNPEKSLAPVFQVFFYFAAILSLSHLLLAIWSGFAFWLTSQTP